MECNHDGDVVIITATPCVQIRTAGMRARQIGNEGKSYGVRFFSVAKRNRSRFFVAVKTERGHFGGHSKPEKDLQNIYRPC